MAGYISGKCAICSDARPLAFSNFLLRLRPDTESVEPRLLFYYLSGQIARERINLMVSATTYPNLKVGEYLSFEFPLPPREEQRTIAAFLDHETVRIDRLIEKQQRLIELLKEKRQAVISHAVTKGLNPDAPMKDSGVEWLGEVPAHWSVCSLRYLSTERCDGPFGSALKSSHYTDGGARVIRLQNIRAGRFDKSDAAFVDEDYFKAALLKHAVLPGDLLIAGLGDERNLVGRACVAPPGLGAALVKADCFRFRLDDGKADPDFMAHQLSAGAMADGPLLSSGSTRQRISLLPMGSRKVALPPPDEQTEIVLFLKKQSDYLDTTEWNCRHAIELLSERRSALISAAVTGKIDVRDWKSPEREDAAA